MIFSNLRHIRMIRNGLAKYHLPADNLNIPIDTWIVKTQTRRTNRGTYKVGRSYAVQRKRGAKAEPDIRIVMDRIWEERVPCEISEQDARAEGGYTPDKFEDLFTRLYPLWRLAGSRWAFEFHVVEKER